ncbi:hypothetical protein [Priestia aryabhattai]|uniref:hypothetical protein n=1 Tax=Priestia aryabhattai TaxID=412384 RepID=UPI002E1E5039|nr:hypothetical protein [Priestia aryabhattai]
MGYTGLSNVMFSVKKEDGTFSEPQELKAEVVKIDYEPEEVEPITITDMSWSWQGDCTISFEVPNSYYRDLVWKKINWKIDALKYTKHSKKRKKLRKHISIGASIYNTMRKHDCDPWEAMDILSGDRHE